MRKQLYFIVIALSFVSFVGLASGIPLPSYKPKPSKTRFLNTILFIDKTGQDHNDKLAKLLMNTVFEGKHPIVASNFLFRKTIGLHKKNDIVLKNLLQHNNIYRYVGKKNINPLFSTVVIIPHRYNEKAMNEASHCPAKKNEELTDAERAVGLYIHHEKKLDLIKNKNDLTYYFHTLGKNSRSSARTFENPAFLPILEDILIPSEKLPGNVIRTFFQIGQDTQGTIATLDAADCEYELALLTKYSTKYLFNFSINKTIHMFSAYQQSKIIKQTPTNCTIVNFCATNGTTPGKALPIAKLFKIIEQHHFSLEEKKPEKPITLQLSALNLENAVTTFVKPLTHFNTLPFCRFANSRFFIPLKGRTNIEYLTNDRVQQHAQEKKSITISTDKKTVVLSPSLIPITLELSTNTPAVLSASPRNTIHIIERLLQKSDLSTFVKNAFIIPMQNIKLSFQKIFLLKEIEHSNGVSEDVAIIIDQRKRSDGVYAPKTTMFVGNEKTEFTVDGRIICRPTTYNPQEVFAFLSGAMIAPTLCTPRKKTTSLPLVPGQQHHRRAILELATAVQPPSWQRKEINPWHLLWATLGMYTPSLQRQAKHIVALAKQQAALFLPETTHKINVQNPKGQTALHLATRLNNLAMVKKVLAKAPQVNISDNKGNTPLFDAIKHGNKTIVNLLLTNGAWFDVRNKKGQFPITIANKAEKVVIASELGMYSEAFRLAAQGDTKTLNKLWSNLPPHHPKIRTYLGHSLLHTAVANGKRKTVKFLATKRFNINQQDRRGNTPLHTALEQDDTTMAHLLITLGADTSRTNNDGITPAELIYTLNDNVKLLNAMVNEKNFDPYVMLSTGVPLLHAALEDGHYKTFAKLLDHPKADPNGTITRWTHLGPIQTSLFSFTLQRKKQKAALLLTHHKKFQVNRGSTPPLIYAVEEGNLEVCEKLIKRKDIDINQTNKAGRTALHSAASTGNLALAKLLLCHRDINPNIQDVTWDQSTPLHVATTGGHKEIVAHLLQHHKLKTDIKNGGGKTPLDLVQDEGIREIIVAMRKK